MVRAGLALVFATMLTTAVAGGEPEAGAIVFKKCMACHAVGEGAANKVGPELNGLFGRAAGSAPNYNYSAANKSSGIVWTEEIFANYIRNPREVIPGTKMAFAGLRKDQEIADLVAYLRQFGTD